MRIALKPHIKLFNTQYTTLKAIATHARFFDFSEMGAGKTWPQCLLALGVIEDKLCNNVIIVVPKIVLDDWYNVFRDVLDCNEQELVTVYYAPKDVRPYMELRRIIITSYEVAVTDIRRLLGVANSGPTMVVFDEAHKLRTHSSARTKAMTLLAHSAARCYLLTGSPLVNGLKNAFSYIHMLWPGKFYTRFEHFKLHHMVYNPKDRRQLLAYKNIEKVEKIIAENSIRFRKREVTDLPPISYVTRRLDWDPKQKAYYKELLKNSIIELETKFIVAEDSGSRLVRFHQILTHPEILGLPCESTRWTQILDDLEDINVAENKVVIVAHYQKTIERLAKLLSVHNPAVIYGKTRDSEVQKNKFKYDDTCRVGIIHPQSAGVGINWTESAYMIMFEYAYDLDSFEQVISRIDRPGQTQNTTIISYVVRGSMEEKRILPSLINKKQFSMKVLNDPAEFMAFVSLDEED